MAGKRKASEALDDDDAPGSSWPHPPWRGPGNYFEYSSSLSDYSEDSRSDRTHLSEEEHAFGEYSSEESQIADILDFLKLGPSSDVPAEAEVQQPPPSADQPATAEVADQFVGAAAPAPAPDMVVPFAEPVRCLGCGREPALVRLVPVKHACLCLPCRSSPSGRPRCEFCDGPRH